MTDHTTHFDDCGCKSKALLEHMRQGLIAAYIAGTTEGPMPDSCRSLTAANAEAYADRWMDGLAE